eukprot:scaffold16863_cov90-Isochrysis_galbana.AAC.1
MVVLGYAREARLELAVPRVDDIEYAVDCERSLGDVSRHDHLWGPKQRGGGSSTGATHTPNHPTPPPPSCAHTQLHR